MAIMESSYLSDAGSTPAAGSKCLNCEIELSKVIGRGFCSRSCLASYSNRSRRTQLRCLECGNPIYKGRKYCSRSCMGQSCRDKTIERWLSGEHSGLETNGIVCSFVKQWLRDTRGDACELCGWAEVNQTTGKVPVVADHIDGDWTNNQPSNLRLVCPNCDSLQSTYMALNKGNGRRQRKNPPPVRGSS